ncbi:MAG: hypothetical protein Q4B85_11485 [Lachnospiraceae bacterium]|nr:hypothetical protein [Lachnospiraceae bacterium]
MMKSENKKSYSSFVVILLFVCLALVIIVSAVMIMPAIKNTKKYNAAVNEYNAYVESYNNLCQKACVDNIGGMAGEAVSLEPVAEGLFDVVKTLFQGNSASKIASDTETLLELARSIQEDMKVIEQITDPDETWVMERIRGAEHVTDLQCVTLDHDPNQMLGKSGGYKGCIYFSISVIDPDTVTGKDIVDKGTDGGGCVEIYSTLEDAEARCSYLAGFDNTILYTGSYAIVGTMVIRTSYRLNDEQQYALTDEITLELTRLDP